MTTDIRPRATAGNEATGALKLIALVFMCCDHFGKMLFPNVQELRMLGRIALPLYAWALVVGCCYTRHIGRYLLRIAAAGLISQPIYLIALVHMTPVETLFGLSWYQPNIFLTLLLGAAAVWAVKEKKAFAQWWLPPLLLWLAVVLKADYGWKGVALPLLFYACRKSRSALAAGFAAFCLLWGASSTSVTQTLGITLQMKSSLYRLLSVPLLLWQVPEKWNVKLPVWLNYCLYPAHLVVLLAAEKIAGLL